MQVHNYAAAQTLFSFSNWGSNGGDICLGIGNRPTGDPDWTFANNAAQYTVKMLQVYVKVDTVETTPPTVMSAQAGAAGTLVMVEFSEAISEDSITAGSFSIDNGVGIISTRLLPDKKRVAVATETQPAATMLTLTLTGIHDLSGNEITPGTTIGIAPYALPPAISTNAGALADGYKHILALDIEEYNNFTSSGMEMYCYDQSSLTGNFDRVAYYLELVKPNNTVQYVWTSMDAFTMAKKKLGVPTFKSGAIYQQYVNNLVVKSNVSGVWNGTSATGNLEFWPYNYSAGNTAGIPGASGTGYDFGDMNAGSSNHGSMQVHNYLQGQTVFAFNKWNQSGTPSALGIGNRAGTANTDWTFADNTGRDYIKSTLYVLVRPAQSSPVGPVPEQIAANVPSSDGFVNIYTIDLPVKASFNNTASNQIYTVVDNSRFMPSVYSRVAYYLELQAGSSPTQYIWTAMDKFTEDYTKLKVPVSGTHFRTLVSNLDVLSNVGGIVNGNGITTGNIEFWPSNYNGNNDQGIPNATTAYDFGDGGSNTGTGYGSMQVHNHGASQVLWAVNNFNNNNTLCIGIGNRTTSHIDYTFALNAGSYNHRRLYVFVLPDHTAVVTTPAPAVARVIPSTAMNQLAVTFAGELSDDSADPANFALNNGVGVSGATLLPGNRTVRLDTGTLIPGQSYVLTMSNIKARAANAEPVAPGTTYNFTVADPALPSFFSGIPEVGGYALAYEVSVENKVYYAAGCNYTFDQSLFPLATGFDRVAYCMELETNGIPVWAWVSMDAYTPDIATIGVPTGDRNARWQQIVNNMNVYASANAGVTTGTGISTGNIEFWPNNYNQLNEIGIPGASVTTYDFGDRFDPNVPVGHGSMQIHNYGAGQTIISLISFGSDNRTPGLGIGNNPVWTNNDPDWTHTANAAKYNKKNIYVFMRASTQAVEVEESGAVEIFVQPQSRQAKVHDTVTLFVYAPDGVSYQWMKNGLYISGARTSNLHLFDVDLRDAGDYSVIVTDSDNNVAVSATASLTVIADGTLIIVY